MSAFTHHRRFHRSRHWHYFNQSEKSPGSLAELLSRRLRSESSTCMVKLADRRPILSTFFSQFSKAKPSEGQFQSQIDHSTQGKPLKKASRRPREQNASLCSGRCRPRSISNTASAVAGRPPAGKPPGEAPIGLPRSSVGLMLLVILIEYLTFI